VPSFNAAYSYASHRDKQSDTVDEYITYNSYRLSNVQYFYFKYFVLFSLIKFVILRIYDPRREGGIVFSSVCVFVCVSVCLSVCDFVCLSTRKLVNR